MCDLSQLIIPWIEKLSKNAGTGDEEARDDRQGEVDCGLPAMVIMVMMVVMVTMIYNL